MRSILCAQWRCADGSNRNPSICSRTYTEEESLKAGSLQSALGADLHQPLDHWLSAVHRRADDRIAVLYDAGFQPRQSRSWTVRRSRELGARAVQRPGCAAVVPENVQAGTDHGADGHVL